MSSAASLSLLKGGKKAALDEELEKPAPQPVEEPEAAEEEVVVDVDTMSSEELDALVVEHGIEVPDSWAKMKVEEKRAWLKEQFEETEEAPADPEQPKAEEPKAEEPKPEAKPAPKKIEAAEEPAPAKASEGKKKGKGKSKAVAQAPKSGTVEKPGEDVLSDLVHEIENLKEHEAREAVQALNEETEMTLFKLGGVLSVIQANGWYAPYGTFREYVEKELGMHYRKATYWVAIYNHLAESKVPWEKVKHLGWSKLKEIAPVMTLENVDEWVKIAEGQTLLQLIETVKSHKQKDNPKLIGDEASKPVSTMTFKVHEDQKETIKAAIAKAKEQSSTTVDTVALEYICLDFLGGQTMSQRLKKMGLEAALEALEKAFPNTNISVEIEEAGDEAA